MIPLLECYFLIFSFLVCCKGLYNIYRGYECHTVVMTIFYELLFQSVCVCVCVCGVACSVLLGDLLLCVTPQEIQYGRHN